MRITMIPGDQIFPDRRTFARMVLVPDRTRNHWVVVDDPSWVGEFDSTPSIYVELTHLQKKPQ